MKSSDRLTAEGALYTDEYQLTMAQLYYRMGIHKKLVQFDHFFRNYPDYGVHKAGYCINAGLEWLLDWMKSTRFRKKDIYYLSGQKGRAGKRLFHDDFLKWLLDNGDFSGISLKAIPEGRVIHAGAPITIVKGPLAMAQILETPLLNHLNYPILVATKAARLRERAGNQLILDFGLRRGHERGVNAGVRAALIGGVDFSSGVGISHVLGFPPKGTHAHSMVQTFMALGEGELGAFRAYADVYPDDCLLLVDTIDTLESGIPNAIKVFEELRRKGHRPFGVRLDSGDLAYLSIQASRMLDQAGFPEVFIVLSNQLDEVVISQIIHQIKDEASKFGVDPDSLIKRLAFGVGTRLVTSAGCAALDGVYKLVSVREGRKWLPAIKLTESITKIMNPGQKQLWRVYDNRGKATADMLALQDETFIDSDMVTLHHPTDQGVSRRLKRDQISRIEPLLEDVIKEGVILSDSPSIDEIRALRDADIEMLDAGVRRLMNPHIYHISLTEKLWNLKREMTEKIRR
jgi:nicotinate phosphoribosyltransferase